MPFPTRLKFNFLANYANLYAPMNGSLIKPIFRVNFDCATGIEPFIGQGPATYTCASTAQYSAVCDILDRYIYDFDGANDYITIPTVGLVAGDVVEFDADLSKGVESYYKFLVSRSETIVDRVGIRSAATGGTWQISGYTLEVDGAAIADGSPYSPLGDNVHIKLTVKTAIGIDLVACVVNPISAPSSFYTEPIYNLSITAASGNRFYPINEGPGTATIIDTLGDGSTNGTLVNGNDANWIYDELGVIRTAAIDQPRIEKEGLLLEGASENLFLNSQAPVTQSIILAAGIYTISVVGTGSISTSYGSATESSDLTFTTVGETLSFTVIGSLDTAQVEKLPFATSIIYTAASPVTRAATNLTYPVPAGFDPTLFSCEVVFDLDGINTATQTITAIANAALTEYVKLSVNNTGNIVAELTSTLTDTLTSTTIVLPDVKYKAVVIFDGTNFKLIVNGTVEDSVVATASALTAMDKVYTGSSNATFHMFGHLGLLKINDYDVLAGA